MDYEETNWLTAYGSIDDAFRGGSKAFNIAMDRCPLIFALHQADTIATMREKSESWQ